MVRILKEQPDWAETLRSVPLDEEVLNLPAHFDQLTEQFNRFVQETPENNRLANERLARSEEQFNRMAGRFANFEGGNYEQGVAN